MNDTIINPYTLTTVIVFLILIIIAAYFIKKKSSSLKKIINKKINIIEYLPIRGGYSAIIFAVEDEKFFFVSHKSGSSNLVQIINSENKVIKTSQQQHNPKDVQNTKDLDEDLTKKNSTYNQDMKKPLEQVNISDLLALHKKV